MKKNITINLFGTLYAIDDDAYELLERYLEGMKSYFCRQEGGEEIVDDIEHRIAELFWELKGQGCEAINIENVKEIIQKIGNPEQMSSNAEADQADSNNEKTTPFADTQNETAGTLLDKYLKSLKGRRLYRNTSDKMLAGVLSGFTKFLGGSDPLPARLIFVLLVIFVNHEGMPFFWFWVICYLICWVIMPEARTSEDRLRMEGKKVTPENLQAQILEEEEQERKRTITPPFNSGNSGCLTFLLKFIVFGFLGFWGFIFLCILFGIIMAAVGFIGAMMGPGQVEVYGMGAGVVQFIQDNSWWATIGLISGLIAVIIPIYAILRKMFSSNGMSGRQIFTLLIIWVIALALGCGAWVSMIANWDKNMEKYEKMERGVTGPSITQPYDFKNFTQLETECNVEVHYIQADSFDVRLEGPSSLIGQYKVYQHGKTLYCEPQSSRIRNRWDPLKLFVTAPMLNKVEASSSCAFFADSLKVTNLKLDFSSGSDFKIGYLEADNLQIENSSSGSGKLSMKGNQCMVKNSSSGELELEVKCDKIMIDNSSSGDISLEAKCGKVSIDNSSSGDITLDVECDELVVDNSSRGTVNISGKTIRKKISNSSAGEVSTVNLEVTEESKDASANEKETVKKKTEE